MNIRNPLVQLMLICVFLILCVLLIYIWVLPTFFSGFKSYSFLTLAVFGAFISGGYYGFKAQGPNKKQISTFLEMLCCAVAAAVIVAFFSFLILLNVLGS